ncbi:MAG: hypothetical protein ACI9Y8_001893 [Candidatus Omnitrophota bacterium]|jgi:hypothetical protein
MNQVIDAPEAYQEKTKDYFDKIAKTRHLSKAKNWYYYKKVTEYLKSIIPANYNVLEIGSGDGDLLKALEPQRGLGLDASQEFVNIAKQKHSNLEFRQGFAETTSVAEKFDYIVLSNLVGYLHDAQQSFEQLHAASQPHTRIVIHYYNYLWEPFLKLGEWLGLKLKQGEQNWLTLDDLKNLLDIAGFETIKKYKKILFPFYIPIISNFINRWIANLPIINSLCLSEFIIARPKPRLPLNKPSVSIMIPTKDESGNIQELLERIPVFPCDMEVIVVDGKSIDGTQAEVQKAIERFPEKNIKLLDQGDTKGKGPAVRIGFDACKGDILMILDSDISVAPEDTPKFYHQLVAGNGEMINGTRLVYPMEKRAMRFLNMLANHFFGKAFSYLLDQRLRDTLCGTKALFRSDYQKIVRNRAFFGDFDPFGDFDLLFGAAKLNLRIIEIPVRYYERRYGDIKIHRFRHGLLLIGMCAIALRKLKFT